MGISHHIQVFLPRVPGRRHPSTRVATTALARWSPGVRAARLLLTAAVLVAVGPSIAHAGEAADATGSRAETGRNPWDGTFRLGPIVFAPELRIDTDWRHSVPAPGNGGDSRVGLSGKRIGVEARVGKRLGVAISAELTSSTPWRNVKADYRLPAGLTVTGGQFKVPFSLDGSLSASDRDFVFRSRLADAFTMGRDRGIAVESHLWRKRLVVEGGVFARDGDRVASDTRVTGGASRTSVARITVAAWSHRRNIFRDVRLGLSVAASRLDQGRSTLTLRTLAGQELTSPLYWAQGTRRRTGVDLRWRPGPVSVAAEYLTVADERRGQGTGNDDLAPVTGTGWYLEGTWLVTGEDKAKRLRPRHALQRGGVGALELVARAERARLGEAGFTPALAASPRAALPALSDIRVLTTGVNWYPAAGARLQFNVTHETIGGATATPLQGRSTVLTSAVRLQLFL